MTDNHDEIIRQKREHHVIFCTTASHAVKGTQAEHDTVEYLLENLDTRVVGDYRLLVNYNIVEREQNDKTGNALEVDILVINRLGVFLLEIKDWRGIIKPHDNFWIFKNLKGQEFERKNPLNLINYKARVLHSQLFEKNGDFPDLGLTSVIGLVVLTHGVRLYMRNPQCHDNTNRIVDLHNPLIEALSTRRQLFLPGNRNTVLTDDQIEKISKVLYDRHVPPVVIVQGYRIERELSQGMDLYTVAFEAQHTSISKRRVRLKRYQLVSLVEERVKADLLQFQRSIQALSALEGESTHPHILRTENFLDDELDNPDVFYEITELPTGPDLAQVMEVQMQRGKPMPFARQLAFLEPVGKALQYAHNHRDERRAPAAIYHRNVCPETIFQMRDGTIKLGDFDFAKMIGEPTITSTDVLIDKPYTAPELLINPSKASAASDIYALGVLWYFLANLPHAPKHFDARRIDTLTLPQEARALLKRMTEQDKSRRPQKMEEVLEALERISTKAN